MAKTKNSNSKNDHDVVVLTRQGYTEMQAELLNRKGKLSDEIAEQISAARELGDLSENQAYSEAMDRKELNDSRVEELELLLSTAKVVEVSAGDKIVDIGHTVEIEKLPSHQKRVITLVGKEKSQEADPKAGKVSIDSPIGKVIYLSQIGDTVIAKLPAGDVKYKILKFSA